MGYIIDLLIIIASLIILFFAYFKRSELGKLSVYVIFGSMLLQNLFSALMTIAIFDFMKDVLSQISTFVVYGEIILLIILFFGRLRSRSNKYFKISLIFLILVKLVSVLGIV